VPRSVLARLLALGCAAALACGAPAADAAQSAQVTIDVPQGKLKSVRLRHLPRGTRLAVSVTVSGGLDVELVSGTQLKSGHAVALLRAALDRKLSFRLMIPTSDDYYLVLDNRHGDMPVRVTATVTAARGKPTRKSDGNFDQTRAAGAPGA
jgi:hypothetical protein